MADTYQYTVILKGGGQLNLTADVDLLKQYLDQIKERKKKDDWWNPIIFKDDEGTIVAAFPTDAIASILKGNRVGELSPKKEEK